MSFVFNELRTTQLAAHLLKKAPGRRMEYIKLLKLLYIADRRSLALSNQPLTGDTPVAMPKGPVPSTTYDMVKGNLGHAHWAQSIQPIDRWDVMLVEDPGSGQLCRFDEETLDAVFEEHGAARKWAVVDGTHEFEEWKRNRLSGSGPIPYEHILEALGKAQDIPDMQRVRNESLDFAEMFGA